MACEDLFRDFSSKRLLHLYSCIESCLHELSEEQVWARDGDHENAVGNLVLHLCGNLREFIMVGIGGQPNTRRRDLEFSSDGRLSPKELQDRLRTTVTEATTLINGLRNWRLLDCVSIKGNNISILVAIYHAVEHFANHAGQIFLLTKQLTGRPLSVSTDLRSMRQNHSYPSVRVTN